MAMQFFKRLCPSHFSPEILSVTYITGFSSGLDVKEYAYNEGDLGLIPGLGRSAGEGNGYQLLNSVPENPHGQRSLAGYCPSGCKESDTTEQLNTHNVHYSVLDFLRS